MTTMASQITRLTVVYLIVYSDADQRKYQNSSSLAFVPAFTGDRWIPRTKGQSRRNVSIWWRHHVFKWIFFNAWNTCSGPYRTMLLFKWFWILVISASVSISLSLVLPHVSLCLFLSFYLYLSIHLSFYVIDYYSIISFCHLRVFHILTWSSANYVKHYELYQTSFVSFACATLTFY